MTSPWVGSGAVKNVQHSMNSSPEQSSEEVRSLGLVSSFYKPAATKAGLNKRTETRSTGTPYSILYSSIELYTIVECTIQ